MNNEIKVSVICSTYNHEKYIRKCLDGFVMQRTNFAFEVIIHDDASTDHTADIVREYENKYPEIIKPIYQEENQYSQGILFINDTVLPKTKGEYIAFCEGDDFWIDEHKLQMQYDAMLQHPECVACYTKVLTCKEDGESKELEYPNKSFLVEPGVINQDSFAKLLYLDQSYYQGYCFHTSCYFMKKDVVQQSYDYECRKYLNGDQCLLRATLMAGNVFYIPKETSCYRMGSVGGWLSRMSKASTEELVENAYRQFIGEALFDQMSEYRYHDLIENARRKRMCRPIPWLNDREKILYYVKKTSIPFFEVIQEKPPKEKLYFILLCYFPHVFCLLKKIQKKN